ncbi:MAG: AAA family ATPase [Bacteroidota bacterium]
METNRLVKTFNFPADDVQAVPAARDSIFRQLQDILNDYQITSVPSLKSVQILLVFNFDCSGIFEKTSGAVKLGDRVRLWFLDGRPNRAELPSDHLLFYARLQPPIKEFSKYANDSLRSLDVILLYNLEYEKLNLERHIEKQNKKATEEVLIFQPTEPKFKLERVILNQELRDEITSTLLILDKRKLIYEDWGFNEVEPAPKAILNFFGPSGTGKTMTAHAIASHLQLKILALNYADIESKFVGDAPKNLVKAFDTAQKENAVLFFDEADSFLGKRIANVSSSSDQAVNSLRSQMLILLENFSGIVIFATNLLGNYDKAFESRIFKHLHFKLPDAANRKKIIGVTIPSKVPYENETQFDDAELDQLVLLSDNFSGRHIKNAVLNSLINAVADDRLFVKFEDFEKGFNSTKTNLADFNAESSSGKPDKKITAEFKKIVEEKISNEISTNQVTYVPAETANT